MRICSIFFALIIVFLPVCSEGFIVYEDPVPVHDALELSDAIDSVDHGRIIFILNKYLPASDQSSHLDTLKVRYEGNDFISPYLKNIKHVTTFRALTAQKQPAAPSAILAPTDLIDALALLIAQRFKEELTISYLNEFKRQLEKQKELRILFPRTIDVLRTGDLFDVKSLLPILQNAFHDDLNDSRSNVAKLVEFKRTDIPEDAYVSIIVALDIIKSLEEGKVFFDVIGNLDDIKALSKTDTDLYNSIKSLSFVFRNFRVENRLANDHELKELALTGSTTVPAKKLFIGLVMQKEGTRFSNIVFNRQPLTDLLLAKLDQLDFRHLDELITELKSLVKKWTGASPEKYKDFVPYAQSVVAVVEVGIEIGTLFGASIDENVSKKYIPAANRLLVIPQYVQDKRYDLVLTNAIWAVELVDIDENIVRPATKYGVLMVNMVTAENSKEMAEALNAAALPAGSYRLKSERRFNVFLNSYAGAFWGKDRLTTDAPVTNKEEWIIGASVPIGMSVSSNYFPKIFGWKPIPCWTVFLPVIDIGAVTLLRLSDEDTKLPELTWENVIAPGAYLFFGFRNAPIALGFGFQYGPQLRKVTPVGETVLTSDSVRYGIIVGVDIPLFTFYSK
jgi:hypothetical protein